MNNERHTLRLIDDDEIGRGDSSRRRRNPARELEIFAADVVRVWVADRGVVVDLGGSHGGDFRIDYHDGRLAIGEVGWHQEPGTQEMWSLILGQDEHQVIRLPSGFGEWSLGFERIPRMNTIQSDVTRLISAMIRHGRTRLEVGYFERGEVADLARAYGISYLTWQSESPHRAIFFPPHPPASWAVDDPGTLPAWIEQVLADPRYQDTTAKLQPISADERHVFLMTGHEDPFAVLDAIHHVASNVPGRPPTLPPGITHAWALAQFGGDHAALWSDHGGWEAIPLPPPRTVRAR